MIAAWTLAGLGLLVEPAQDDAARRAGDLLHEARSARSTDDPASPGELRGSLEAALELASGGSGESRRLLLEIGQLARDCGLADVAVRAHERALQVAVSALAEEALELARTRDELSQSLAALGEWSAAREVVELVLPVYERELPPADPDAVRVLGNLGVALEVLGESRAALSVRQRRLDLLQEHRPEDDLDLQLARSDLARTLFVLGDVDRSRELREHVAAVLAGHLPEGDPRRLDADLELAASLHASGELAGALRLQERVVRVRSRELAPWHADLLDARERYGLTLVALERLEEARREQEAVLQQRLARHTDDDRALAIARNNLSITLEQQGDHVGARALQERALSTLERLVPADHPDVLACRGNLAVTLEKLGRHDEARELQEQNLVAYEAALPPLHPDLAQARTDLGLTLFYLHEDEAARDLLAAALETFEATLPPDHPNLTRARNNAALTHLANGDTEEGIRLLEQVVEVQSARLPVGNVDRVGALANLVSACLLAGRDEAAAEHLSHLLRTGLERMHGLRALPPREVQGRAQGPDVRVALWAAPQLSREFQREVFELVETQRHVTSGLRRGDLGEDTELRSLRARARELRGRIAALGAPADALDLVRERDAVERRIRERSGPTDSILEDLSVDGVARALSEAQLAVTFRFYATDDPGRRELRETRVLGSVVRPDGTLTCVDLGPARQLEELNQAWRRTLGIAAGRGVGLTVEQEDDEHEARAAGALFRWLLEPLLSAAEVSQRDLKTLFVCADEEVHTIPLDALTTDGLRLGERARVVSLSSLALLAADLEDLDETTSLLAVGDVDFGAVDPAHGAITFSPLPGTRQEVESIGSLFERAHGIPPALLQGAAATKATLEEQLPGVRFLHIATHGWFTPRGGDSYALAPMTLCGLALADANTASSPAAHAASRLTAEELAGLDLTACELAVLSACETHAGTSGAGRGIQSLQTALHAAGVRAAVTSLWRVDDAATATLMRDFYEGLWLQDLPLGEALWRAKSIRRDAGAPVRDWGGWVLSGRPD